jgi:hypothetical protein
MEVEQPTTGDSKTTLGDNNVNNEVEPIAGDSKTTLGDNNNNNEETEVPTTASTEVIPEVSPIIIKKPNKSRKKRKMGESTSSSSSSSSGSRQTVKQLKKLESEIMKLKKRVDTIQKKMPRCSYQ